MTKPKLIVRQVAEAHWQYTRGILLKLDPTLESINSKYLELMKYFYIESHIHGHKHGKEDK